MGIFNSIGNAVSSVFSPVIEEAKDVVKETGELIGAGAKAVGQVVTAPVKAVDNLFSKDEEAAMEAQAKYAPPPCDTTEELPADDVAEPEGAGPTQDGSMPEEEAELTEAKVFENAEGQTIIQTGKGRDDVEVTTNEEGNIHVIANGEEVWSGTAEEFEDVVIRTGKGDDRVKIEADGAEVHTGRGDDKVKAKGDDNRIGTGRGDDEVILRGDDNKVRTRRGEDQIEAKGDGNTMRTGRGDDDVESKGDDNRIRTGRGDDDVELRGDDNLLKTKQGNDEIDTKGRRNDIRAGRGRDQILG